MNKVEIFKEKNIILTFDCILFNVILKTKNFCIHFFFLRNSKNMHITKVFLYICFNFNIFVVK